MKTKELHAMSMTDLQKRLKDSRQELFNLRFQMATGQLANHREIRHVRRSLAQILTEIHLKEVDEAAAPAAAVPAEVPAEAPKRRRRTKAEADK